jgi:glycosyltransferase involved in cell wall biosynthesis
MRIAYICADLGIPVSGNKGASVHIREFTDALVELGHEVHIYSASRESHLTRVSSQNLTRAILTILAPSAEIQAAAKLVAASLLRLDRLRDPAHLRSEILHFIADPAFVTAALPHLRDFAPDLLITRHALFSIAGLELAHLLGCPCVLEVNAPLIEERRRYWGLTLEQEAEQAERMAFADADLLVAVSTGVRDYMLRYGASPDRVMVLPNGVNPARFHPNVDGSAVRRRYGLEGKIVVGFAGSLKPWHGVDLLLHAFASVYAAIMSEGGQEGRAPHLLIIGDGPQRKALLQLSHALGVSTAVTFTGPLPYSEMPAYLAALDIAVAPYRSSNTFYFSPLKLMEYMAMGRAIVAPMLGQIPALLQGADDPCGLLYHPDNHQELGAMLWHLINDQNMRQILGMRAAEQARQHHSWQTIAQTIIKCVDSLAPGVPYQDDADRKGIVHS